MIMPTSEIDKAGQRPIGSVSTFFRLFKRQQERGEVSVPCGSCTACCRSPRLHVALLPAEEARFPEAVPVPDHPGRKGLPKRPDGTCVHLIDGRCGIYATRPVSCRTYDCRANVVVGVFDSLDPIMCEALQRWQDPRLPLGVDKDMRVAFRLAMAELKKRCDEKGKGLNASQALAYALTQWPRFMERARRAREALAVAKRG